MCGVPHLQHTTYVHAQLGEVPVVQGERGIVVVNDVAGLVAAAIPVEGDHILGWQHRRYLH